MPQGYGGRNATTGTGVFLNRIVFAACPLTLAARDKYGLGRVQGKPRVFAGMSSGPQTGEPGGGPSAGALILAWPIMPVTVTLEILIAGGPLMTCIPSTYPARRTVPLMTQVSMSVRVVPVLSGGAFAEVRAQTLPLASISFSVAVPALSTLSQ